MCDHIERNSLYYHYYYYCVTRIDGGSYRTRPPAVYNTSVTCIRHYYIYCSALSCAVRGGGGLRTTVDNFFIPSLSPPPPPPPQALFPSPPPRPTPCLSRCQSLLGCFFFLTNVCVTTTTQTDVRRSVKFRRNGIEANVCVCVCVNPAAAFVSRRNRAAAAAFPTSFRPPPVSVCRATFVIPPRGQTRPFRHRCYFRGRRDARETTERRNNRRQSERETRGPSPAEQLEKNRNFFPGNNPRTFITNFRTPRASDGRRETRKTLHCVRYDSNRNTDYNENESINNKKFYISLRTCVHTGSGQL